MVKRGNKRQFSVHSARTRVNIEVFCVFLCKLVDSTFLKSTNL